MRTSRAAAIATACVLVAPLLTAAPAAADAVRWSHLDGRDSGKLASGLSSSVAGSNLKRTGDLTPESWWGNDSSWNRYAYVENDPINRMDPSGRVDQTGFDAYNNMPTEFRPLTESQLKDGQKSFAVFVGVSISATLAYATSGVSLLLDILVVGPASNVTGGMVTRQLDGDEGTRALDGGPMAVDGLFGAAGAGASTLVGSASTTIDDALGAGSARFVSEAVSNSVPLVAGGALGGSTEQTTTTNPNAGDLPMTNHCPASSCHEPNYVGPRGILSTQSETRPPDAMVSSH